MQGLKLFEKTRIGKRKAESKTSAAFIAICQHLLLWSSCYVVATSTYAIAELTTDTPTLTSNLLSLIAAWTTITYIVFHNVTSYLTNKPPSENRDKKALLFQRCSKMCGRLSAAFWIIACGLMITFSAASDSSCLFFKAADRRGIKPGVTCYVQRSSVAASLLALVMAAVLIALMCKVREPLRYHLFGFNKEESILPLLLPYKTAAARSTFSEMSFKCRSSTSLSSKTLVPSFSDSTTTLLPNQPTKGGLGIFAPKSSVPSFLAPRPSLSSIRSYTETISAHPPCSPLPPLPTYCLSSDGKESATGTRLHSLSRPSRYHAVRRNQTLRIVPPSPALSPTNLTALNQSQVSLSSVYSQDMGGKRYSTHLDPHIGPLNAHVTTFSSNGSSTVLKSRPGPQRLIDYAGTFRPKSEGPSLIDERSDSDIDDAATLQARLPAVRAVSAFGDVKSWSCGSQIAASYYQRLIQTEEERFKRQRSFRPLRIGKTRSSATVQSMV